MVLSICLSMLFVDGVVEFACLAIVVPLAYVDIVVVSCSLFCRCGCRCLCLVVVSMCLSRLSPSVFQMCYRCVRLLCVSMC